jgi:hypothetical protein
MFHSYLEAQRYGGIRRFLRPKTGGKLQVCV